MPRTVFLLGVALFVVALAFILTYESLGPYPGVTGANVRRIKPGMSLAEVEVILGGPGRCQVVISEGERDTSAFHWTGLGGEAYVLFDKLRVEPDAPTVRSARFHPAAAAAPLDHLRKALGP